MKQKKDRTIIRAIPMPENLYGAAQAAAKKDGRTFSSWIRELIKKEVAIR